MPVSFALFALVLLVHIAIFLSSLEPDRLRKAVQAILLLSCSYPLMLIGILLEAMEAGWLRAVAPVFVNGPYYVPLLSFLIYWRKRT